MAKAKSVFFCESCGYESPKWMGKCPGCSQWNTMVEEKIKPKNGPMRSYKKTQTQQPQVISNVEIINEKRLLTNSGEMNRVLGGGIVPGSLVLVGGDPGIGKSTILLQTSEEIGQKGLKVLYISGEESVKQTKMRADRLGIHSDNLYVLAETDIHEIEEQMEKVNPALIVIDSIQTIFNSELTSAPGSVSQVRECTGQLMRFAKTRGIAVFIVGHVTKDGAIAGPRMLEHMVDAVLYFEGERHHTYRILRAVKNRFGSTNELGVFEMKSGGLEEVTNPSEVFLQERSEGVAGSTVVAALEGTRPMLVEIQALVTPTSFGNPRRMATGIDHNRVSLLMAVLEKRVGLLMQNHDAYVNVAGGVRLDEPATDLAVALSIASSFRDMATSPTDIMIGEVGLTGEIRRVSRIEQRVSEAHKMGFKRAFVPQQNMGGWEQPTGMEVIGVSTVSEAMEQSLGGNGHAITTTTYQSHT